MKILVGDLLASGARGKQFGLDRDPVQGLRIMSHLSGLASSGKGRGGDFRFMIYDLRLMG